MGGDDRRLKALRPRFEVKGATVYTRPVLVQCHVLKEYRSHHTFF